MLILTRRAGETRTSETGSAFFGAAPSARQNILVRLHVAFAEVLLIALSKQRVQNSDVPICNK